MKNTRTPNLRFPEFREAGEWSIKPLAKICEVNPSVEKLPEEFVYIDLESVESGRLLQKKVILLDGAPSRAQRLLKNGDVIFQTVRPYQKNNYFFQSEDDLDYVASTGYAQLRAYQSNAYLFQYLHNDRFVSRVLEKCTGSNYPAINSSDLAKVKVEIPDFPEQQKIAATLTTLDDLITAQNQQLAALQAHKKGLMQQLFPAEGERTPRLRFGEFEGEWEYKTLKPFLEEYSERVTANTDLPIFSSTRTGLISQKDYYNGRELINEGEYGVVPKGYFVYRHMSDDSTFKFNINEFFDKIAVSREYPVFRTINLNSHFLFYKLNGGTDFKKFAERQKKGGTRTRLYFKILCTWRTLIPSLHEQQKIAACLSSLDALITIQTQKIQALQAHKKGLMQQLFPNPNDG